MFDKLKELVSNLTGSGDDTAKSVQDTTSNATKATQGKLSDAAQTAEDAASDAAQAATGDLYGDPGTNPREQKSLG